MENGRARGRSGESNGRIGGMRNTNGKPRVRTAGKRSTGKVSIWMTIAIVSLLMSGCMDDGGDDESTPLRADAGPDHLEFFVKDERETITIRFDGSNSSGNAMNYEWDFDRTGPFRVDDTGAVIDHTYTESGKYSVTLKVYNEREEDFDISEIFINYQEFENASVEDGGSDGYPFPVRMPASRVYGEIRYDPGGIISNDITIRITDDEGNSTDNEGTERGEREEGGKVVRWIEMKGEFVLQYRMGEWSAHVERDDSAGGSEEYSLYIEVDYDPASGV